MRRILILTLFCIIAVNLFPAPVPKTTLDYWSQTMLFGTPKQKMDALKQMRGITNKAILDILIKALKDETDEKVRKQLIQILYEKKEPRALDPLLKNLKTATNPELIATTLAALGQLKNKKAVSRITNFLKHEKSEVIQAAVRALGMIEAVSAGPVLLTMLTNTRTDKEVVYPLLNALGKIRYKPAFPAIRKIAINTAKPQFMRAFAITALGRLRDTRALDDFFNLLKSEKNIRLRLRVIGALGEMKNPKALQYFRMAMSDSDKSLRYKAVEAAGKLKSKKLIPVLLYKLKFDKEPLVMVAAAEALYGMGVKETMQIVMKKFEASVSIPILDRLLKLIDKAGYRKAALIMQKKQKNHKVKKSSLKDRIEAVLVKWGKQGAVKKKTGKNKGNQKKTGKKGNVKKNGRIYLR